MGLSTFKLRIEGIAPDGEGALLPTTLSVSLLLKLLASFEEAVRATSESLGVPPSDRAAVVLLGHGEGSSEPVLGLCDADLPAGCLITEAIFTGDYSQVPAKAQCLLHDMSLQVTNHDWSLHFIPNGTPGIAAAAIDSAHPVPPPPRISSAKQRITIYGKLVHLGGIDETKHARLLTERYGRVSVEGTEDQAKELRHRVFERVGLVVEARVGLGGRSIGDARLVEITPYRHKPASEAFAALREVVAGAFDDVDPDEYVRELRGGAA